jgi:hypothetical protein
MVKQKLLLGMLAAALAFGMMVVGCEEEVVDNTIYSVSISLGSDNNPPKAGKELSARVKNKDGGSVSDVSYQWKRADSQNSTFVNINNATTSSYKLTIDDAGKYIKVEAKNSDTAAPVESVAVGPVDANQVAKPTVDPDGGQVLSGQEITLTSTTTSVTIRYTLDGTTPTSSSNSYSNYSKSKITSSCTLKAIATSYGMVDSEVLSVSYTVVAAPSFSLVTSSADIFSSGIYSIAYGNNRYVTGGNIKMAYSTNGTTWTAASSSSGFPLVRDITYGTQFVAVGDYSGDDVRKIVYSSDGASWSSVTATTFGSSNIKGVAYGSIIYVAVGEGGKMAYSTNGINWTAVTDSTFGTSTIYGITYAAGKFVAVGASGKMAYSTNGTTWTAVADSAFGSSNNTINGITYGGPAGKEKFIAVGGGGSFGSFNMAYSTDGVTWTRVYSSYITGSLNGIVWGGNKFIAVGSEGNMLYSLDGINWAQINGGTGAGKTQFNTDIYSSINDIVYVNGKFLAVGSKYVNASSSTGEMAISSD